MTLLALKLENFGDTSLVNGALTQAPEDAEEIRLSGYESGYQSGWEDATAEQEKSGQLIAANLERNLGDISFSYAEARSEVVGGLKGLFDSILNSFLPAIAAEAVIPLVAAELDKIVDGLGETRCELVASPGTVSQLDWLVGRFLETDIHILPEPAFADGRVCLRFGTEQRDVDLSNMVQTMAAAIRDFTKTDHITEERKNA